MMVTQSFSNCPGRGLRNISSSFRYWRIFIQNKKYRCAMGRHTAGSEVSKMPSARTV